MIDVGTVAAHALWVVGLAVILTTFSYRSWASYAAAAHATADGQGRSGLFYYSGLLLIAVSLLLLSSTWLQRAGWGVVLLLTLYLLLTYKGRG